MFWKREKEPKPDLEAIASLMAKYLLDEVHIAGVTFKKSKHLIPEAVETQKPYSTTNTQIDPDEALAWSTLNAGRY